MLFPKKSVIFPMEYEKSVCFLYGIRVLYEKEKDQKWKKWHTFSIILSRNEDIVLALRPEYD